MRVRKEIMRSKAYKNAKVPFYLLNKILLNQKANGVEII